MLIIKDNNILSDELLETINNEYSTFANKINGPNSSKRI